MFHTLEGPQEGLLPPPLSNENLLINELVREYLSYNGYVNALGVFLAESGQPSDRSLDRAFLRDEVRIVNDYAASGKKVLIFASYGGRYFSLLLDFTAPPALAYPGLDISIRANSRLEGFRK